MKNEKTLKKSGKISKKVLWTRIVCILLAFMMVAGSAYVILEYFLHSH